MKLEWMTSSGRRDIYRANRNNRRGGKYVGIRCKSHVNLGFVYLN